MYSASTHDRLSESKSQTHFTTGGLPPISSSWQQVPWDSRPAMFFFFNWTLAVTVLMYYKFYSPAQSFSGPSPMGLITIFYCLRFETSLFRRFLRLAGLRCRYSTPPPHGIWQIVAAGLSGWHFSAADTELSRSINSISSLTLTARVGRLNCCWSSPALQSPRDPRPRCWFSPRHCTCFKIGLPLRLGRDRSF
jgi:hypothetical protein